MEWVNEFQIIPQLYLMASTLTDIDHLVMEDLKPFGGNLMEAAVPTP